MPKLGTESERHLRTCDERLQRVIRAVVEDFDVRVLEGHRGEAAQNKAVADGASKLAWPKGKHNAYPSRAVDVVPHPLDWKKLNRFYLMAGLVMATAKSMGIKLRWGGAWDQSLTDAGSHPPKFLDLPHFEILD